MSKRRVDYAEEGAMDFGVRVGVALTREAEIHTEGRAEILLVKHKKPGVEPYWVLPGGRLEPGESIPDCARRELLEETRLSGEFSKVLYVSEFMRKGRHTVDVTVRMTAPESGNASLGHDPEVEPGDEPTLEGLAWLRLEDLPEIDLKPPLLKERLIEDFADDSSGETRSAVYLGGDPG